jgi:hypothetical protein
MIYCKTSALHCELFNILIRGYTFSIMHCVGISLLLLYFGLAIGALVRLLVSIGLRGVFLQNNGKEDYLISITLTTKKCNQYPKPTEIGQKPMLIDRTIHFSHFLLSTLNNG